MLRVGLCSKTPGAEPEEPGRSKGEVHIFNIYIIDSKRFQVDWLKTLGQVHYTRFCVRRTDGRTDAGRTDGHHLELRTFNYTKSRFDTHRYHFRWKQKMHARTGQNLYGPLTIVRRAIKSLKSTIFKVLQNRQFSTDRDKTLTRHDFRPWFIRV